MSLFLPEITRRLQLKRKHAPDVDETNNKMARTASPNVANDFENLQITVCLELRKCARGNEMEAMQCIVKQEPWVLSRCCAEVKYDLFCILEPLRPIRLKLFGSTAMNMGFRG